MIHWKCSPAIFRVSGAIFFAIICLGLARTPEPAKDGFTFAASGDILGTPPGDDDFKTSPDVTAEVEKVGDLFRGADVGFANFEGVMFNLKDFRGARSAESNGGGSLGGPPRDPALAEQYKAFGITMMSQANNHAADWGIEGSLATNRIMDIVGITHAGLDRDGVSARAPAYLKTAKGTVALVAAASTYPPLAQAGDIGGPAQGRGGIFGLRTQQVILVTREELAQLRAVAARQSLDAEPVVDPRQILIGGQQTVGEIVYRLADAPGQTWEVNQKDRQAILTAVATARKSANFVVFSIHAHERQADGRPADFLQPLFHDIIDAGADVIVRHGAHFLNGIEVYKGRAIFYDMNSSFSSLAATSLPGGPARVLAGDNPTGTPSSRFAFGMPALWNDGAVTVSEVRGGRLSEVRVNPVTFRRETPLRGAPVPATGADARRILDYFQRVSAPYGTKITVDGDVGVIHISGGSR